MSIDHRIYPYSSTLCFCGHLLECCSDCYAWLLAESPRIAEAWLCWPGWDLSRSDYGRLIYEGDSVAVADYAERYAIIRYELGA